MIILKPYGETDYTASTGVAQLVLSVPLVLLAPSIYYRTSFTALRSVNFAIGP